MFLLFEFRSNLRTQYNLFLLQILKHIQTTLQNFHSRVQVDIVAIEATAVVVQSLLIALYVDPSDAKAVEQAIGVVVDK